MIHHDRPALAGQCKDTTMRDLEDRALVGQRSTYCTQQDEQACHGDINVLAIAVSHSELAGVLYGQTTGR